MVKLVQFTTGRVLTDMGPGYIYLTVKGAIVLRGSLSWTKSLLNFALWLMRSDGRILKRKASLFLGARCYFYVVQPIKTRGIPPSKVVKIGISVFLNTQNKYHVKECIVHVTT